MPSRQTNRNSHLKSLAHAAKTCRVAARAVVERLEQRKLLAFTWWFDYDKFFIHGDFNGDDDLKVEYTDQGWVVYDHGVPTEFMGDLGEIIIRTGDGNDNIVVNIPHLPATVESGDGKDTIKTSSGNDEIDTGVDLGHDTHADEVDTDGGKDRIHHGRSDKVNAGDEDDELFPTMDGPPPPGFGSVNGGAGNDLLDLSSATVDLRLSSDGLANDGPVGASWNIGSSIEIIIGGSGDDSIVGAGANEVLRGGAGNDTLIGNAGNDILDGGEGADSLVGAAGVDLADYSARSAPLTIILDALANDGEAGEGDVVHGSTENVAGGAGNDTLSGSGVNNALLGNGGQDSIRGGGGADTLDGGPGGDNLAGEDGIDTVTYESRTTGIWAAINGNPQSGETGENDLIDLTVENLTGGSGNDVLVGSAANNQLAAGAGNDTVYGGDGTNDVLSGDAGNDWLYGEEGQNWIYGGDGDDTLTGGDTYDFLYGDAGNDSLLGGLGSDNLTGGAGQDYLRGGPAGDAIDSIHAADGEYDVLAIDWAAGENAHCVWDESLDDTIPA